VHHVEAFTSAYLQACQDRSIQAPNLCLSVSAASQGEVWQHYGRHAPRVINGLNGDRFSPSPMAPSRPSNSSWASPTSQSI
jgi:hypothetical protein